MNRGLDLLQNNSDGEKHKHTEKLAGKYRHRAINQKVKKIIAGTDKEEEQKRDKKVLNNKSMYCR